MEFNVGKVGINLGGWYGIFLGDKGSLSVYMLYQLRQNETFKSIIL